MSEQQGTDERSPFARLTDHYIKDWYAEALREMYEHQRVERWWNEFVTCGFSDLCALQDYLDGQIMNQRRALIDDLAHCKDHKEDIEPALEHSKERIYPLLLRLRLLNQILEMRGRGIADLKEWGSLSEKQKEDLQNRSQKIQLRDLATEWKSDFDALLKKADGRNGGRWELFQRAAEDELDEPVQNVYNRISQAWKRRLQWPSNVEELERLIKKAVQLRDEWQ